MRSSNLKRETSETTIETVLDIDGYGKSNVETGIGFFDHMLQQLEVMVQEGFLKPQNRELVLVDTSVEGLIKQMQNYKAPAKMHVIDKVVR